MIVLGIDPGTATVGYGFVREDDDGTLEAVAYGVITTSPADAMPQRLQQLYRELARLVRAYRPDAAAVEQLFFGKNITTAISVAQGRGVLILALADAGIEVREYKPHEVKQTITGYGNASKSQMQQMVQELLGLEHVPRPDDAADALAVALTDLRRAQFDRLISE